MKKLLFILLITIPFISFSQTKTLTNEDKVKIAVRKHHSLTMNDFKSYQSVQWLDYQKKYLGFELSKVGKPLNDSLENFKGTSELYIEISKEYKNLGQEFNQKRGEALNNAKLYLNKYDATNVIFEKEKAKFTSGTPEYFITHVFRGKNAYSALIIQTMRFSVNYQYKVVDTQKLD